MRSRSMSVALCIVAVVLGLGGVVAGHVNRTVIDGDAFASNVDALRRRPDVAEGIGREITAQVLAANPDLIALRPLVEVAATRLAGSETLSGAVRVSARLAHDELIEGRTDRVVMQIADIGSLLTGALAVLAPDRFENAGDVSVTLATIGDQGLGLAGPDQIRWVPRLAWLLPVLAAIAFASSVVLAPDRWRAIARVGKGLVAVAAVVALVLVAGSLTLGRQDAGTLTGAVVRGAWHLWGAPLWIPAAVVALVGIVVAAIGGASVPSGLRTLPRRALTWLRSPIGSGWAIARALTIGAVGIAFMARPIGALTVAAVVTGVALVLVAVDHLASAAAEERTVERAAPPTRRWWPVALVGVLALAAMAAFSARPGEAVDVAPLPPEELRCNGHEALCDRTYDRVANATAHNAMSVASEPGWFIPLQLDPPTTLLDQGVRGLMLDVWSGAPASTRVRTASGSRPEAEQVVREELGSEVLAAAGRIADSLAGAPVGPEARYLCHGLCETGATPLRETLSGIRAWMLANPTEVVTVIFEDHVAIDLIVEDLVATGLADLAFTPPSDDEWPTLREMIERNERLVVMAENADGGDAAPWLVNAFAVVQDTPYSFQTADDFSCAPNRGPETAPLLLINHWLTRFDALITSANAVNVESVLGPRVAQCAEERNRFPTFVAVDYVGIGDVLAVVDDLNGVS
jgi:hypothetical protein